MKLGFTTNSGCNFTAKIGTTSDQPERYYNLKDHLGSVRVTVDEAGEVVNNDDYYPFGAIMPGRSQVYLDAKYRFTGKERDTETGYDYFGARYYDSRIGRWLQVDPLADKYPEWSPYNYALNNPVKLIDPNGMFAVKADPETGDEKYKRKEKSEAGSPKELPSLEVGGTNYYELTQDASNRMNDLGKYVDENMPVALDAAALVATATPGAQPLAIGLSAVSTAWTFKNEGNSDKSWISLLTTTSGAAVKNKYLQLAISGAQLISDFMPAKSYSSSPSKYQIPQLPNIGPNGNWRIGPNGNYIKKY